MIWHVCRVDVSRRYDLDIGFVVRAATADAARVIACTFVRARHEEYRAACWNAGGPPTREEYARMADDENAWVDVARSTVVAVLEQGPAQVIVNVFRYG